MVGRLRITYAGNADQPRACCKTQESSKNAAQKTENGQMDSLQASPGNLHPKSPKVSKKFREVCTNNPKV